MGLTPERRLWCSNSFQKLIPFSIATAVQCQCKLQGAKSLVTIPKVYKATQSKNKRTLVPNKAMYRECVIILDLRVQVHPGELWVSKKRVHIVLEASKSAGAKGDVPKIYGLVHPLHPC